MVADRKPTPEKQLLSLIENPESGDIKKSQLKRKGFGIFSLGNLKAKVAFFGDRLKEILIVKKGPLGIGVVRTVNRYLWLIVFFCGAYFIFSITLFAFNVKEEIQLDMEKSKEFKEALVPSPPTLLKKTTYYLEKSRTRDIFDFPTSDKSEDKKDSKTKSELTSAMENLKLVGISWSDDPEVIIEDTKRKKTLFLKRGSIITSMDIKIEAIFQDKVILSYKDEEMTLR